MSKISKMIQVTSWNRALNAARKTIRKKSLSIEPSKDWEAGMLLAEHSPIRLVEYDWSWEEIKQFVTCHLVRHHVGCEKFVSTQRSDRADNNYDRDELPQGTLNTMDMTANVQSIMNISRKRLCQCSSKETREAWEQVVIEIRKLDEILADKCAPECVYRGFCPEFMNSCGYSGTPGYQKHLVRYRRVDYKDSWTEIKKIPGYEISKFSDIRKKDTNEIINQKLSKENYLIVKINSFEYPVHELVAETFLGENVGKKVGWKDNNIFNNQSNNLYWI